MDGPHQPDGRNLLPGAGSEQSEGSKLLTFLGVLLPKPFRFLTPFGMTS